MPMAWRRLDLSDESGASDELLAGIAEFRPVNPDREADRTLTDWLQQKAPHAELDVWLFADGSRIVAYHTVEQGWCEIPGSGDVESLHVAYAARDRDHPRGGREIVAHTLDRARAEALDYVTSDPLDPATADVWRLHRFLHSLTPCNNPP